MLDRDLGSRSPQRCAHLGMEVIGGLVITSHDVARLAGVSQATVSRALRDSDKLSEETKRRVRKAAADLGYSPNVIGRALALGHSTRVGLVVTDLHNHFYGHVIPHLHDELHRHGYELVLITESSETAPVAELIMANGLCGVILTTTTVDSLLPARLRDRGIPFVYFNRTTPSVDSSSVTVDPEPGLSALVQRILTLGHRRVGAVFGPRTTSTGEARESIVRSLFDDQGVYLRRQDVRYGQFDFETGLTASLSLLDNDDPPTVLVCANDVVALGALNGAAQLGLDVPEFVSIVGFDDLPTSSWPLVQLTTVAYDLEAMSREAGLLLIKLANGGPEPFEHKVFETRLVTRRTLGKPRARAAAKAGRSR
jgi:LacI family transcriptional regulator